MTDSTSTDQRPNCSAQTKDWSRCERVATVTIDGRPYCAQHGRATAKAIAKAANR
jgi:hypothetical protein